MSARPEAGPDTSHLPVATALCEVLRHEVETSDGERKRALELQVVALWRQMQQPRAGDLTIDEALGFLDALALDSERLVPALARQA